jgi:hypothetical protein
MALSATFTANFSSFYDAVDKAELKLKDFAAGADKVGARLTKMGDQFSGVKIVQEAALMVKAVEDIGGVSKLTEKELARLGATTNEAVAKMKALGMEVPANLQAIADKTKGAASGLKQVGNAAQETSTKAKILDATWGKLASAFAVGSLIDRGLAAVGQGFQALGQFMADSVSAAIDAEKAQSRMVGALEAQNVALPGVIKHYDELASKFMAITKFDDDTVREAITTLTQIGQVVPTSMDAALEATTNLASALQKELPDAADLVAKAVQGNVSALKKMGIELDATKVKAEGADYVFRAINDRFGGAAQKELRTFSGQLEALSNQWGEFQEQVGGVVLKTGALQVGMAAASVYIKQFSADMLGAAVAVDMFMRSGGNITAAMEAYRAAAGAVMNPPKGDVRLGPTPEDLAKAAADMQAAARKEAADRAATAAREKAIDAAKRAEEAYQSWKRATIGLSDAERELLNNMLRLAREGGPALVGSLLPVVDTFEDMTKATAISGKALTKMGEDAANAAMRVKAQKAAADTSFIKPTDWGTLLKGALTSSNLISATNTAGKTIGQQFSAAFSSSLKDLDTVILRAITGGGNVGQAIGAHLGGSIGGDLAKSLGKTLQETLGKKVGGLIADMLPGLGSLAGGLLGSLVTKIGQIGQNTTLKARQTFAAGLGYDNLNALLDTLATSGAEGKRLADLAASGIGKGDRQKNEAWMKQVSAFFEKEAKNIALVTEKLGEAQQALAAFGGVAPKAIRPMVESLMQMQGLPASLRDQFAAFAEAPSWQTLERRAQELGIELSALGGGFNQQRLASIGFGLFHDLEAFMEAGADLDGLLRGMSDELSTLASEALKTGAALPKSLEPYMRRLKEMGLLVDANGNAIEDLTFEDLEDESLKAVVKVLEQIRELLARGLPQAATTFGRSLESLKPGGGSATVDGSSVWTGTPGAGGNMTVVVEADGRELTRIMTPYLPGETRRMGLARA